ncbi:MAG: hypothetical protein QXQ24_01800 [Nitrososphaeria archaeon]
MGSAFETKLNVLVGRILSSEFGLRAISESIYSNKRPDVIVYINGVKIVLEGSYFKHDAERDIEEKLERGLAELGIALHYTEKFSPNLSDSELELKLRNSIFGIRIIVSEDISGTLIAYLEGKRISPKWVTEWMEAKLSDLLMILNETLQFLLDEKDIEQIIDKIEDYINDFVLSLKSIDNNKEIARRLYDIFYKLYGLSVGDYEKIDELIYAQAALAILLSEAFYQSISSRIGLQSLSSLTKVHGYRVGIREAFTEILKVDYKPIYEVALQIIDYLPDALSSVLKSITELAEEVSSKRALLKRDFSGKIYHKIVGDWSIRKGFATYFTTVPASYLLAYLAIFTPTWNLGDHIRLKVGDFACGSGTLLTASYNALKDLYVYTQFNKEEDINLEEHHKQMLEEDLWGFDTLKYAVQITSLNLAFQNPSIKVLRMNTFSVPLGLIPNENKVVLGSLEFLEGRAFPEVYIEIAKPYPYMRGFESAAIIESEQIPHEIPQFDFLIMNPPFTRATGRGGKKEGGLFGFIIDENIRKQILNKYNEVREKIKNALERPTELYFSFKKLEKLGLSREIYNIGQAGEGLLFLYLAYKLLKNKGKIAFVLPKSLLTGISWTPIRCLLLNNFHIEYIVLSYDAKNGYNFSESTSLSETLIIAKKGEKDNSSNSTTVILLLNKPLTALEARAMAFKIINSKNNDYIEVNSARAFVFRIKKEKLVERISNWGSLFAFPVSNLSIECDKILSGSIFGVSIPMIKLGEIATVGIDRHQFHDIFNVVLKNLSTAYPVIYGGEEKIRMKILTEPNSRVLPKNKKDKQGEIIGEKLFKNFSSKLLVPDRIRVNTTHALALYSIEPVLSNVFYAIKLKYHSNNVEEKLKTLCLWFNTTWGILSILANRSETEGGWINFKMTHWRLQPILDVSKLDENTIRKLALIFDKYCNKTLKRINEQFNPNKIDSTRLNLDKEFLATLGITVDDDKIIELYKLIDENLKIWLGD